ncbi:MAG: transposase family protein [Dechloromonas sp.]|nr:transposase family protein [Dechloromonas sp.]
MGSFFLQKGLVISYQGQILEYDSRSANEIYFENQKTGKKITLTESEFWSAHISLQLKIVDAFSSPETLVIKPESTEALQNFRDLNLIPERYQLDHDRRIAYISKLKKEGITRGQKFLIADSAARIAKEIADPLGPPGTSTISRWWKEIDTSGGDLLVVINGNSFRKRTKRLDKESEGFLQNHIDDYYAQSSQPTIVGAHRDYAKKLKTENAERASQGKLLLAKISERTYGNRIADRPEEETMIARVGREEARRYFKMAKGHLPAEYPLDVVEIDHTPMNLYVIDDHALLPLGRPWLTAIKDRYSGVLLGFYVSFQKTGLNSIFGAIKHSLSSHHLAYELWPDIENPWPAFGRAVYYLSDRGGDFNSPRYRNGIKSLGSFYEYSERRTPWLKGSIERFFLTLEQTFFESMPGRTFASLEKRGDYDSVNQAVVRFSTLIYLLHKWAADFHNIFVNVRNQATPLELWQSGIEIAPPSYPCSIDELNIVLGEHHTGILSQEGIRFSWQTYADDQLEALMKDIGRGKTVKYVVCDEDLGQLYVEHPATHKYLCVPSTRPEYSKGLSRFQHNFLRAEAKVRLEKSTAIDTLIETRNRIQSVLAEELETKKTAGKVQLARLAGINSQNTLTGETRTILAPFGENGNLAPSPITPSFTNVPSYAWGS